MALNFLQDRVVPLAKQRFTWKEFVQRPYSKLDDDAFTRVRMIRMNGLESEALRFSHACARMNKDLQRALAHVRRIEQHQQTLVDRLNPADHALETTMGSSKWRSKSPRAWRNASPTPIWPRCFALGSSKTSTICTAMPRSWIVSKARTRTPSCRVTRTFSPTSDLLDTGIPTMICVSRTIAQRRRF